MTTQVAAVQKETPFRQIVEILAEFEVSAVPVVDSVGHVVGVVSEADLLHKVEFSGEDTERHLFEGRRQRAARAKATGDVAEELMASPAVTAMADTTVTEAARIMYAEKVKRLPVIDDIGRLIGVVSRSDLLLVHLRTDEDIQQDIADEVLVRTMWLEPHRVQVSVDDSVVTLAGQLDRRTEAQVAVHLTRTVAGVVDVVDQLTYEFDDLKLTESKSHRSHPFSAD